MMLALASTLGAHAAKGTDPAVGLHAAAIAPPDAPPPLRLGPDLEARLAAGEAVATFVHDGKHDQVVAAVTTKLSRWQVWAMIQSVEDYGEFIPLEWARLESKKTQGDLETTVARFKVDVPLVRGEFGLASTFSSGDAFMAFYMMDDKKGVPVGHAVGYWEVFERAPQDTLVVVRLDFNSALPLPEVGVEEQLAGFMWNLARTAEERVYARERWLRSE